MSSTRETTTRGGLAFLPSALRRRDRSIKVRILDGGHEVDSFEVSTADLLRAEMKAIGPHLPKRGALVQYRGIEEQSLPLGIARVRREVELEDLQDAVSFLTN